MPSVDELVPRGILAHGRDGDAIAKDDVLSGGTAKTDREDESPVLVLSKISYNFQKIDFYHVNLILLA